MKATTILRKGLADPAGVPAYLLGRLLPHSRWGPEWRREDGYVTFEDGGFAGGSPSRPELSARIFYEVESLRDAVGDREFERSLEVGCGYGRLSGWIADYAAESVAVEPNRDAVEQAGRFYPTLSVAEAVASALPFGDDRFDLAVTWLVLAHVPPDAIEAVAGELTRVLSSGGALVVCEQTTGEEGTASWPRSRERYEELFAPLELVRVGDRGVEPGFEYGRRMEVLAFEGGPTGAETNP